MHGMTMAPGNGGSGGSGNGDDGSRRRRHTKPSGVVAPVAEPEAPPEACNVQQAPMPVVLTQGTLIKFALVAFGPLLVTVSAMLAFYWKHHFETVQHQSNGTIHLTSGERAKLETKLEAKDARKRIVKTIKTHVDIKVREIRVEQKAQVQKLGEELKAEQKKGLDKVLNEVRGARRDVRSIR